MPRKAGSKNIKPSKDELYKRLQEKQEEESDISSEDEEVEEKKPNQTKKMEKEFDKALDVEQEPETDEEEETKEEDTEETKETKRKIREYYVEFKQLDKKELDNMNEDELKDELKKIQGSISKKNAENILKYLVIGGAGMVEYIGVSRGFPLQGYQNNISNNEDLDDIIKEIKIKYGFNKFDNILSPEFRLLFLMTMTGYSTIQINRHREVIGDISNKETNILETNYKDL
jgi:hypothetical protein